VPDGFQLLGIYNQKRGLIMRRKTVCRSRITILVSIECAIRYGCGSSRFRLRGARSCGTPTL